MSEQPIQQTIQRLLDADQSAHQHAESVRQEAGQRLESAREEAESIKAQARSEAEEKAQEIRQQIKTETESQLDERITQAFARTQLQQQYLTDVDGLREQAQQHTDAAVNFLVAWVSGAED